MEEKTIPGWKVLNGNVLKIIAILTMIIDHIGAALIEPRMMQMMAAGDQGSPELMAWLRVDHVLRFIGRTSFPIFCFLLAEGFLHTRDTKKYAGRLLLFALISEIPFDLAFFGSWFDPGYQNVFFTLFLGLAALTAIKEFRETPWKQAVAVVASCGCAMLINSDYGAFGVFFVILLYLLRYDPRLQTILGSASLLWEPAAILAFLPIRMYNGARGHWNLKYVFYAFYPVHLLLFAWLRYVMMG